MLLQISASYDEVYLFENNFGRGALGRDCATGKLQLFQSAARPLNIYYQTVSVSSKASELTARLCAANFHKLNSYLRIPSVVQRRLAEGFD